MKRRLRVDEGHYEEGNAEPDGQRHAGGEVGDEEGQEDGKGADAEESCRLGPVQRAR